MMDEKSAKPVLDVTSFFLPKFIYAYVLILRYRANKTWALSHEPFKIYTNKYAK